MDMRFLEEVSLVVVKGKLRFHAVPSHSFCFVFE